ncbi:hypothetical protein DJ530_04780 [Sulfolobus sp. E1]|nr:hypothetical protein DJ530_04780 [Sulfolobus sp. E1]
MMTVFLISFLLTSLIITSNIVYGQTPVVSSWGWGTPQNPIKAYPGYNDTPFYVLISLPLGYQVVYAYLSLYGTPITSESGSSLAYGSVTSSSLSTTTQITFFLNINQNAKPGTYNVPLTVVYQNAITGAESQVTQTITIPIYNVTFPILQQVFWGTTQQVTFAQVGEGLIPLTFVVFNPTADPMINVTLNVFLPNGIYSQTNNQHLSVKISALPPGQPELTTVIVNVSSQIKPGVYNLTYEICFTDFLGYWHKDYANQTTSIVVYPLAKLSVYSNPIYAIPGNTVTLLVKISSNVTSFVYSVKPIPPSEVLLPISSNFTPSVIQPAKNVVFYFNFYVIQDVLPSIYPIPIELNYSALGSSFSYVYLSYIKVYYNESPQIAETAWNTTVTPFPGIGVMPLTLYVYNPLPYPITGVNITYNFPSGIIPLQPYVFLPGIPQFQMIPITIPVEITPNASIGVLNYTYRISYNGDQVVDGLNNIYVLPPSPVIVELNKTIVSQGGYDVLPLKVINLGAEYVYNLNVVLLTQGLEMIASFNNTIPFLKPNSSITLYYTIYAPQDLPPAVYQLLIKLYYVYFTSSIVRTFTIPISVVSSQNILLVNLLKTSVYYDTNNTDVIQVVNLANYSLYNVQISLNYASQEIYLSTSKIYIPFLPPHYIYTLPVYIIPQIPETTSIPINILMSYIVNSTTQTYQDVINLLSTGFVKMEITQVSAQVVNNSVVISGVLINTGSQSAQFVTVYLNNYTSLYIGSVPPNSPTPFSFTLSLPPGRYTFNVSVTYENQLYQPNLTYYAFSYIASYPITSSNKSSFNVTISVVLAAVIMILISVIIYLSLRKRGI